MDTQESRAADTAAEIKRETHRLYRIPDEGVIGGVCAGIADYFVLDPLIIRVIFIALVFITGGGWIVLYLILWFIVPDITTGKAGISSWHERRAARREARRTWHEEMKNAHTEWKRHYDEHSCHCHKCWKHRHRCHGGLVSIIIQAFILWLVISFVYYHIPSTQPFWHHVGDYIQTAWAWLNAKVAH